MNNYKTTKKWSYREYEVELSYVEAGKGSNAMMFDLGFDLADEYGVKASASHFSAVAIINDRVMAVATGIGQESAVHNLYSQIAKNDALKDIEKNVYGI